MKSKDILKIEAEMDELVLNKFNEKIRPQIIE
jgi:hypothetical protein